jgi:hypothetical protein
VGRSIERIRRSTRLSMDLDKMEGKTELGWVPKLTVFMNPIGENYTKEYSKRIKNHYLVPQKIK